MAAVLQVIGIFFFLGGGLGCVMSKSAIQETPAMLSFVVAAVLFSAGSIIERIDRWRGGHAGPGGLGTCPDCGGGVSKHAEACPHCGRPRVMVDKDATGPVST